MKLKGITTYQLELLRHLANGEGDSGRLTDFDQLLCHLSWTPTKESAQFTIRAVIKKGFVEKAALESRRGRNRVCYKITEKGRLVLDPRESVSSDSKAKLLELVPGLSELDAAETVVLES